MNSLKEKLLARKRPLQRPLSYRARPKTWRRRCYQLNLPGRKRLLISFRRFRTNPARDSKKYRQLIVEINDSAIREVAIAIQHRPRPKSRKPSKLFLAVPAPAAAAFVLIFAGIAGAVFFSTHLHKHVSFNVAPSQKVSALVQKPSGNVMPASTPVRLQIPKIGVDSNLLQVGLQSNGQMETPWDITAAAWYKYSPTPGQLGPSVIVGHLDGANYANMAGVFYKLNQLAPGDEFSVTRADGSAANFKVLYLKQVPQNNFPTQEIYGNINYAGIRLITCGGTFNTDTNHYTDNTVVFGALE